MILKQDGGLLSHPHKETSVMNANTSFQSIDDLNLDPIKRKLMHAASGEGWSRDKADAVEKEYRRYLCVKKAYPDQLVAPTVDVDTFWHYHILDTAKYAADCEHGLGYFLHHYPYLGMDDDGDDAPLRIESGDRMGMLYEMLFGDAYPGSLAEASGTALSWCGGPWPAPATGKAETASALAWCVGPPTSELSGTAQPAGDVAVAC
jgi:hypothetical protein